MTKPIATTLELVDLPTRGDRRPRLRQLRISRAGIVIELFATPRDAKSR